jgi:hypothetical protein
MRSTLSFTLVAALVMSVLQVSAEQRAGPPPTESNWSRVRNVRSGTEVIVTVRGWSSDGRRSVALDDRYVVLVNDSGLTLLSLASTRLPGSAAAVLRDVASNHPDYFPAAQQGRGYLLKNNVRIGPAGVFMGGRRVAELGQVVEGIPRADVVQIVARRISTRGSAMEVGRGVILGFLLGVVAAGNGGTGPNLCDSNPRGCVAFISAGPIVGGLAGYFGGRGETIIEDRLIYQAP